MCREGDEQPPASDIITSLLDKHLLPRSEQGDTAPRLRMHETIRASGLEALIAHGEMEMARHTHALYYLGLVEEAEPHLVSTEHARWLARLEREHANLRAALDWLLEGHKHELALRLSSALFRFWAVHSHLQEGRSFLERALAAGMDVAVDVRAKALLSAGLLAIHQGDYPAAPSRHHPPGAWRLRPGRTPPPACPRDQ